MTEEVKAKDTTHFMGKKTGYELIDGAYHIAPMYSDWFDKLADQKASADDLMKSVIKHLNKINTSIASEQRQWWEMIYDDLGLDKTKVYSYQQADNTIRVKESSPAGLDKDNKSVIGVAGDS